ncbi:MAG: branched-chain amino acid transport system ATP-binding protein, partial [Candidatus Paceibacteria bacterium]
MSFLEVKNATLKFGGVVAVNDLSFNVEEGEVYAIVGPNGAGKSTVFNLISRFYDPYAGSFNFNGTDLLSKKADEVADLGVARTFQNIE